MFACNVIVLNFSNKKQPHWAVILAAASQTNASKNLCALKTTEVKLEQCRGVGPLCNVFNSDRFLSLNSKDNHLH